MRGEKAFGFSAATEAIRAAQLNDAALDRFAPSGRAVSFVPVLHGSTSDPVFQWTQPIGWKIVVNNLCHLFVDFEWGEVGGLGQKNFPGAGEIYMDLPSATLAVSESRVVTAPPMGRYEAYADSVAHPYPENWSLEGNVSLYSATTVRFAYRTSNPGAKNYMTYAAPFDSWSTGGGDYAYIRAYIVYRVPDGFNT